MPGVRDRNIGWRIDYFLVSNRFINNIKETTIYSDIYGSDHCQVGLEKSYNNKIAFFICKKTKSRL